MKKILLVFAVLTYASVFSQQKTFNLNWNDTKTIASKDFSFSLPFFTPEENYDFSLNKSIRFTAQWDVGIPVDENSLTITNVKYLPISINELKDLDLRRVPVQFTSSLKNSNARNKTYALLTVSPIVKNENGGYKKVVSFSINYKNSSQRLNSFNRVNQTISHSVLSSGSWYKFAIDKSGVFKLNKDYFDQLGINTNGIDPRTIKIFGNGGRMMAYRNDSSYPFDPVENAIKFIGEDDGSFNNEDYILFYGEGPKGIIEDASINTNLNPYTDLTYYYINIGPGQGKRIQPMVEPAGAPNLIIDSFQDHQFHEVDEFNLGVIGRRWFGDKLDIETTKTFDFSFPNLVTSIPVKLKAFGAAVSANSSSMKVSMNGSEVSTFMFSGIAPVHNVGSGGSFQGDVLSSSSNISIQVDYDKLGVPSAVGYLDYITIEATRELTFSGSQFKFKNNATAQTAGIGQYNISNTSSVSEIWNITDLNNITNLENNSAASNISFKSTLGTLKTFVAVTPSNYFLPLQTSNSQVANQNIKGTVFNDSQGNFKDIDYVILTPSALYNQAERLAQVNRERNNLNVKVLRLGSIYSEFNTGNADISSIRNVVKYIYDNASSPEKRLKYLCLFGDGSVDYKGKLASNTYIMPSWHAYNSFSLASAYVSDDFFGMMDPEEGALNAIDKLDIAVGRVLADSPQRAKEMVDKVITYYSKEAFGSWRNSFVVVSDDIDLQTPYSDWERILQETTNEIADLVTAEKPFINVTKIHSDSFQQEATAGGDRYPQVTVAMANAIENGALVVNYFGHGGEDGLAFERIFQKPDVEALRNECKLSCFVTVTCEYTRFDNPFRTTAGELLYWNKRGGAIGLITTTRQISVTAGVAINKKLEEYLFSFNPSDSFQDHEYPSVAEALRLTKTDAAIGGNQKRLVFFIGDPALKLAIPKPNVRLTKINDMPITGPTDVIEALSHTKLSGEVTDLAGNVLTNYNGKVVTTIYDKEINRQTLANDGIVDINGNVIIMDFKTLGAVVFRGQASVVNGEFEFDFIVPRDVGIPVGYGKVSFYASTENQIGDQTGATINTLQIGGLNEDAPEDNEGPLINLYMNDENFASGGVTNESPTLLVKLQDENGINTASGIGHDIVATIDGDEVNPIILNDYYLTELDDYTRGGISFPLRDIEPGLHTLTLKAWDVYNNSSTAELQFMVFNENEHLVINNVLNYPNPFVNYTEFWFSHNSSEALDISIQVFTISGKLVRTLNGQTLGAGSKSSSSTSRDIVWDGRDDYGDKIGKGTYVYKLTVHSSATNKTVEKIEKLVIL